MLEKVNLNRKKKLMELEKVPERTQGKGGRWEARSRVSTEAGTKHWKASVLKQQK